MLGLGVQRFSVLSSRQRFRRWEACGVAGDGAAALFLRGVAPSFLGLEDVARGLEALACLDGGVTGDLFTCWGGGLTCFAFLLGWLDE